MSSQSSAKTKQSPKPAASLPRPGTMSRRIRPDCTSSTISRSTCVGALRRVCTCATEARGGSDLRKFKTSAMRVLFMPARCGSSSNILVRIEWIACTTFWTSAVSEIKRDRPISGRGSSSISSSAALTAAVAAELGLRRALAANGELRGLGVDLRFLTPETGADVRRRVIPGQSVARCSKRRT